MDAVTYLKEKNRMTNNCKSLCSLCLLGDKRNAVHCGIMSRENPEKLVELVEKWSKENPAKTYEDVIIEKFPNFEFMGVGECLPKRLFGDFDCKGISCDDCLKRPYEEVKE